MTYEERLQNVSVLGAAGKMGSGILLLTAVEMADLSMKPENKDKSFVLNAIDVSPAGLAGLMKYLREQIRKVAERKTVQLRKVYADRDDLIENYDIIDEYIFDVMNVIRPVTNMSAAYDSNLIFEAVSENRALKVKLLSDIDRNNKNNPWYFTNTSSVPISLIESEAGIDGRVIGFHFYNPPAVQRLVELIKTNNTKEEVVEFAHLFAKNLRKIIVPSNDFAGFIGNGHFMRDALHGMKEAEALAAEKNIPLYQAIYMINKVTQDYLVRPMGIFQLVDYVGIDVVQFILNVMNPFVSDEDLHSDLLDKMILQGVKGGQKSSGAQKDGFLKYKGSRVTSVWDIHKQTYVDIDEFKDECDDMLGTLPDSAVAWKSILRNKKKGDLLASFFNDLKSSDALGALTAVKYGRRSKEIGEKLVADEVANEIDHVNTVMLTGFFHAYGPVNNFFD
ncbi:MAG TPA: 3-hydroxyacyl-CoA dehydrogenase family protein [Bacteroidales bacterium]|jgi:3-hydroxyacyl-CoA dehydrogenase|nr:3-hydroxybutyryl-CoA dehydrogenase [Bacteroidota bacterium]MAE09419.1 3-hydroxybutyryl-CoA dehydrogenase [Bacteroidota bacterium]HJN05581.1 3-hydroxyacyl-CoA dehydrogenase family protein [Bacteroidales bacterium]